MPDVHDSLSDTWILRGADWHLLRGPVWDQWPSENITFRPANNGILNDAEITASEFGRTLTRVLGEWGYFDPDDLQSPFHPDNIGEYTASPEVIDFQSNSYILWRKVAEEILSTMRY